MNSHTHLGSISVDDSAGRCASASQLRWSCSVSPGDLLVLTICEHEWAWVSFRPSSAALRPTKNHSETWGLFEPHLEILLTLLLSQWSHRGFLLPAHTHFFMLLLSWWGKTLWISFSAHFYGSSHPGDSFPLFLYLILSSERRISLFYLPFFQFARSMRVEVCCVRLWCYWWDWACSSSSDHYPKAPWIRKVFLLNTQVGQSTSELLNCCSSSDVKHLSSSISSWSGLRCTTLFPKLDLRLHSVP